MQFMIGCMWRVGFVSVCASMQIGFLVLGVSGADFWQQRAGYNSRIAPLVFTGTEVIAFGGTVWYSDYDGTREEGGVYNLANDTWRPTSRVNCPMQRYYHSAIWTGKEMIVWGGFPTADLHDGYKYDPVNDTWTPISMVGAPMGRWNHTAVWTGKEMIVWGGESSPGGHWMAGLSDGGRYDPETDTWLALAPCPLQGRSEHSAVWTGSEMIIFGGHRVDGVSPDLQWTTFGDGARYDLANNSWAMITSEGEPAPRFQHTAIWTGSEMIIWGGGVRPGTRTPVTLATNGASYNPESDSWKELPMKGAPEPRMFHTAVWTGDEMIIWGGSPDINFVPMLNTGGRYNSVSKKWRPTTLDGAPEFLLFESAQTGVWTGEALFLHAPTYAYSEFTSNQTWLYYPEKPRGGSRHH
jgi:hypothetical protein